MSAGESRQGDRTRGDKINSIQAESGASVKIQNQSDVGPGQPRRITITGSPDRVARASQLVYALIQDGSARRARGGAAGRRFSFPLTPNTSERLSDEEVTRFVGYKRRAACACRWIARIVAYKSRATPGSARCAHAPSRGARRVSGRRGDVWTDDDGDSGARSRGKNHR